MSNVDLLWYQWHSLVHTFVSLPRSDWQWLIIRIYVTISKSQVHEMAMVSAVQEAQKDNLRNFSDYMMTVLEVSCYKESTIYVCSVIWILLRYLLMIWNSWWPGHYTLHIGNSVSGHILFSNFTTFFLRSVTRWEWSIRHGTLILECFNS